MPFDLTKNTKVTLIDSHCGHGKTTTMLKGLSENQQYLIVTPLLSEVDRIVSQASVEIYQPLDADPDTGERRTKQEHLRELVTEGHNVVTTHALFTDLANLACEGLLLGYDVIIDEVLSVAGTALQEVVRTKGRQVSLGAWKELYVAEGFATIDPITGQVSPTQKWIEKADILKNELSIKLFHIAQTGCLYAVGDTVLIWELPPVLMSASKSLTVLTYMAEGFLMAALMRRHDIKYQHDVDPLVDLEFSRRARELITVRDIPSLKGLSFSFSAQSHNGSGKAVASDKKVATALKNLRERHLKNTPKENIMITCAKDRWFAKGSHNHKTQRPGTYAAGSRLFDGTNWVANTTRGTNDYRHCTHLIYLWNQNINPSIAKFLAVNDREHQELYAVSELIQWVYRSQVRDGKPITLYMPCKRMRSLFNRWLDGDL